MFGHDAGFGLPVKAGNSRRIAASAIRRDVYCLYIAKFDLVLNLALFLVLFLNNCGYLIEGKRIL